MLICLASCIVFVSAIQLNKRRAYLSCHPWLTRSRCHQRIRHRPAASTYVILPEATSITHKLIKPAAQLAQQRYEPGKLCKKQAQYAVGWFPAIRGNLFVPEAQNPNRYLMDMMDNINFSMRNDIPKYAASGTHKSGSCAAAGILPAGRNVWGEVKFVVLLFLYEPSPISAART